MSNSLTNQQVPEPKAVQGKPTVTKSFGKYTPKSNKRYDIKKDRARKSEMVTGIFRFTEAPGQSLSFLFREFKEDAIDMHIMTDQVLHTIPLGLAMHINRTGKIPINKNILDENQTVIGTEVQKYETRYEFVSTQFQDAMLES